MKGAVIAKLIERGKAGQGQRAEAERGPEEFVDHAHQDKVWK